MGYGLRGFRALKQCLGDFDLSSVCHCMKTLGLYNLFSSYKIKLILMITGVSKTMSRDCRNPQVIYVAADWQFWGQISTKRWEKETCVF